MHDEHYPLAVRSYPANMARAKAVGTMNSTLSRRSLVKGIGSAALLPAIPLAAEPEQEKGTAEAGMPQEGPATPKIACPINVRNITEAAIRQVRQIGVKHVLSGGPPIPWEEEQLRSMVDKLKEGGISLGNLMISGFPNTLYGRPGRDEEIEKLKASIRIAGKVGLPVIEYNFYAHRAIEGYYEQEGRGERD